MFDCKCILFKYLKLRIFPFFLDGFPFRGSFYPSSWIPSVHPFPSHLRWCHHPFHPGESQRGPDLFRFCFSPICSTRNKLKSVVIQYGLEITKVLLAVGWVCFTPYSQILNKKCGVGSEFLRMQPASLLRVFDQEMAWWPKSHANEKFMFIMCCFFYMFPWGWNWSWRKSSPLSSRVLEIPRQQ